MKGTTELISPNEAMIGVRTENGGFSVLELIGGYPPNLGDVISGNLENLGGDREQGDQTRGHRTTQARFSLA